MLNFKILLYKVRMACFLALVVWALTAAIVNDIEPLAAESPKGFPLAPINE